MRVPTGSRAFCDGGTFTAVDASNEDCNAPVTTTTTTTPPTSGVCTGTPWKTFTGTQSAAVRPGTIPAGRYVDARTATWKGTITYPITFGGNPGACWLGGTLTGTWPTSDPWTTTHGTGAINAKPGPGTTIRDVTVHGYGDAYRIEDGSAGWVLDHVFADKGRDDCIEDDWVWGGTIRNSLFAGCYVGLSTRPPSTSIASGASRRIVIEGTAIRLEPTATVYSGTAPGHGGWFKDDTRSPTIQLGTATSKVILSAGQIPNHQSLSAPGKIDCRNVVILWTGDGSSTRRPTTFPGTASWQTRCAGRSLQIIEGPAAVAAWAQYQQDWQNGVPW